MTNGWIDIKNTDMMLIMGGNPAENHPCGFKWAVEAKRQRNAKMIVVDPRYTRTAAVSDMFLQIRAGSDIAFLGGVIHYALENQRVAKEYLVNYTNAAFVIKEGFKLPEDGLYSGFDAATQTYDKATWNYERSRRRRRAAQPGCDRRLRLPPDVAYDTTLEHPRCVYQLLKKQYSRYTPEMVERITGIPKDQFLKAADLFTSIRKDGDTQEGRHHHLRRRLDPAQLRIADHPHRRDAAIAARQRRTRGRRRECAARALQHSGRHRHRRNLRQSARLSEGAHSGRHGFRGVDEAHHSHRRRSPRNGIRGITGRTRPSSPCRS